MQCVNYLSFASSIVERAMGSDVLIGLVTYRHFAQTEFTFYSEYNANKDLIIEYIHNLAERCPHNEETGSGAIDGIEYAINLINFQTRHYASKKIAFLPICIPDEPIGKSDVCRAENDLRNRNINVITVSSGGLAYAWEYKCLSMDPTLQTLDNNDFSESEYHQILDDVVDQICQETTPAPNPSPTWAAPTVERWPTPRPTVWSDGTNWDWAPQSGWLGEETEKKTEAEEPANEVGLSKKKAKQMGVLFREGEGEGGGVLDASEEKLDINEHFYHGEGSGKGGDDATEDWDPYHGF